MKSTRRDKVASGFPSSVESVSAPTFSNTYTKKRSECLVKANHLISACQMSCPKITAVCDINSQFFISLFQAACPSTPLLDLKEEKNIEDEIHNVQMVIDTLSFDVLKVSLSHIAGEDIVEGHIFSIYNLLEVFECYLEDLNESNGAVQETEESSEVESSKKISETELDSYYMKQPQFNLPEISDDSFMDIERPLQKDQKSSVISEESLEYKSSEELHKKFSKAFSSSSSTQKLIKEIYIPSDFTETMPKYVDELHTRKTHSEPLIDFMQVPKEQSLPKRKISDSSSISDSPTKNQTVQTSDSLLLKKPRTEDAVESNDLVGLYRKNMENKLKCLMETGINDEIRAKDIERAYKRAITVRKPPRRRCRKSFLLPTDLRRCRRTPSKTLRKAEKKPQLTVQISFNQSSSGSEQTVHQEDEENNPPATTEVESSSEDNSHDLIQKIHEVFPGLQFSEMAIENMQNKYMKHLVRLGKTIQHEVSKKTLVQTQTEEALKKQKALTAIVQKELEHTRHLTDIKEMQGLSQKYKSNMKDANIKSVRIKQYYDKYHKDFQRKMQIGYAKEEMMFKDLFENALRLQNDNVRFLCKQLKEKRAIEANHHKIYLEALENLYKTRFDLLAESLINERRDTVIRARAQEKVLKDQKKELKQKLESEIKNMQESILQNNKDTHFLEMDVERYRENMVRNDSNLF